MDLEGYNRLTETQRTYLRLFARHTAKEIAQRVGRSVGTVDTQLRRGAAKLGSMTPRAAAFALVDFEASLSGRSGTETIRHDMEVWPEQIGKAEAPQIVQEDRAVFVHQPLETAVGHRPSWTERFYDLTTRLTPAQNLIVIIVLAVLILIAAAVSFTVFDGLQGLAASIRPPRH